MLITSGCRQEVDGTYLLEFHKDERKHDPKGTIVLDFCTAINKVRAACYKIMIPLSCIIRKWNYVGCSQVTIVKQNSTC